MQRAPWLLVLLVVACLLLVGIAAEEHDAGSVTDTHHAVLPLAAWSSARTTGRMVGMGSTYVVSDVHGHLDDLRDGAARAPGSSTATTAGPAATRTCGCSATSSTADPTASA